jgi:serine/threonine protein kinase
LGQGGMSAVYKAYDPNLKRVVAIKLIHTHLAGDPKFLSRFEEEATAVAQLRHPNIVQVFDFNHDEDLYYMVQEFVDGETLQERLRRLNRSGKRMPVGEAIQYTTLICEAAGYAHRLGMIHRDIKPANIMIDVHGQAILMDFGIVKITGGERHTTTGALVGTAIYLPPELIRGEAPDPRSDIYSLGVTLFETVSGRPPFEADSAMSLLQMHLNDPLPDLRQLRPGLSEDLVAVIEKSLAKDRDGRYNSMAEMATALKSARDHLQASLPMEATQVDHTLESESLPARPQTPFSTQALPQRPMATAVQPIPSTIKLDLDHAGTGAGVIASSPPTSGRGARETISAGSGAPVAGAMRPTKTVKPMLWIGAAAVLLAIILGGIFLASKISGGKAQAPGAAVLQSSTAPAANLPAGTETPLPTPTPILAPTVTPNAVTASLTANTACLLGSAPEYPAVAQLSSGQDVLVRGISGDESWWNVVNPQNPTDTCWLPRETVKVSGDISVLPLVEPPPLATGVAPGSPSVEIKQITIDSQNQYVVEYVTHGFTEKLPGMHIHFFFDTIPPDQVGMSGGGNRLMYGGPSPFNGYRIIDRPANAAQLCALVANPDHTVIPDSGNCFKLP